MIKRAFIGIACVVGGVAAVVVIFLGIMAWRLSSGPVSLGALTPVAELALGGVSGSLRVALDDTVLMWDRPKGTLDVRLVSVQATDPNDEVRVRVPEVSIGLNVDALLRAVIAPTEIEVVRPELRLVRPADDGTGETEESSEGALSNLMSALAEVPEPGSRMYYLTSIRVVDGSLDVEDRKLGLSWKGALQNTRLWREPTGLSGESLLSISTNGEQAEVAFTGEFVAKEKTLSAGVSFSQFRPATFAVLGSSLSRLAAINLPASGTISLVLGGDGMVEDVGFDILGGVGHLALPVSVARELGVLAAAQRVAVRGFLLNGTYNGNGTAVAIDHLNIDLEPGQEVYLPAPLDHRMPLAAVRAKGRYRGDEQRVEVDSLELDLEGPQIAVTATATGVFDKLAAEADITVTDIQTSELGRYWPPAIAETARDWCTEHLSEGGITEAKIKLTAGTTADGVGLTSLSGTMDIKGLTVDYLPPMPKARKASGVGVFDMNSLTLKIAGGEAEGVFVQGGTVKLFDFDKPQEMADIELEVDGTIPKVLELIDHPPLGFVKAMGLSPSQTGGFSSGRVGLRFPLLEDLPLERLTVSADIKLDQVSVTKIALGANVTNGQLAITLDDKGMDATGSIVIEKTPAEITWRENFETGAPFDTRIDIVIKNADISFLRDLKLEAAPVIEQHVKGPISLDVRYVSYPSGEDSVEVKMDARRAAIDFPHFGWKKPHDSPANGEFKAKLRDERLTEISSFALEATGLGLQGSAGFAAGGELESAKLNKIAVGRTNMEATVAPLSRGGWDIVLGGKSFDVKPLIDELEQSTPQDQSAGVGESMLSVTADLDTVWIDPKHPLKDVSGTIVRDHNLWNLVQVDARVGADAPLTLRISAGKPQSRTLEVRSPNAGDTFRTLGVLEHMIGGELKITGTFDDSVPGNPLKGRVKVHNFRIVKAPGIAKVLSIMALTGILDQLRGQGIRFTILDVPFTLNNDVVEIRDARASGTEIGMTAEGRVANNTLNMRGTIVPFYAVNSLLGRIPIVGSIFRGGEKGGGLLAARYSMVGPMDDPDVTVNPLSMLTPGFLRNLFNVFDSDSGSGSSEEARPHEPEPEHP